MMQKLRLNYITIKELQREADDLRTEILRVLDAAENTPTACNEAVRKMESSAIELARLARQHEATAKKAEFNAKP